MNIFNFYHGTAPAPPRAMASSITMFLDHTQRHNTAGRTPLYEWSARRRDLYLITHQQSRERNIHVTGGFRTHNPSEASDHRPRGHRDRRSCKYHSDLIVAPLFMNSGNPVPSLSSEDPSHDFPCRRLHPESVHPHAPYIPDLAPSQIPYFLGPSKTHTEDAVLQTNEALNHSVREELRRLSKDVTRPDNGASRKGGKNMFIMKETLTKKKSYPLWRSYPRYMYVLG